jgi:hypothetical protein
VGQENNIFGLEGSQAVPTSPFDRGKAHDQNSKFNFYGIRGAAFK